MSEFEKLWLYDEESIGWMLRGFDRRNLPLPQRSALEVFPGVRTFDPVFLRYVRELSHGLDKHPKLQPAVDENLMVSENGIHTGFSRLRTVGGYACNPLSWVPVNNTLLCDSLGIPKDFRNARHRMIFDEFFDLVWSCWKPSSIKVPKHSTFGVPMIWCHEADYKRAFAIWVYSQIDDVLRLAGAEDWESLAREYGMVFCFVLNRRGQVDEPGKVRKVADLEYALTGGASGSFEPTDKSVVIDGVAYDDFSATRERIVQGAAWAINCILQPMSTGCMYALFENYPTVFHHTNPQDIADQAFEDGDLTASDVSQYDASMREFLIRRAFSRARAFWRDDLVGVSETLMFSPYFTRPLDLSEKGKGRFVGDPMNPTAKPVVAGNRSGHAFTSLFAKTMKVFDSLCVIDDLYGDVVGNVHYYLKDRGRIKLRNNGDDECAIGSPEAISAYREVRYDGKHGYFEITPELGQGFSGSLMRWKGEARAFQKLHTPFEKFICPERSIGGRFRRNWPIGLYTRFRAIEDHPVGHYAAEIHNRLWHDICRPVYGDFNELLLRAYEQIPFEYTDGWTAIEREVLDDPDKLYYKYQDSDVSEEVLNAVCMRIQPQEFEWMFRMFNGHIM